MTHPRDPSTTEAHSNVNWIHGALNSFAAIKPKEKGWDYVRARRDWAYALVSQLAPERVPRLIAALFECYDSRKQDAFSELMWLTEALYASLPERIGQEDACAILAATRHSCGHGGVAEPIQLAKAAFIDGAYTPEFFAALRTYRDRLKGLSSHEVTRARGEIALTLWLDPQEPLRPRRCLSAGVRRGYIALSSDRHNQWNQLFQFLDRTARRRPDKKWTDGAGWALQAFGAGTFTEDLRRWLTVPRGKVPLSTGGRHVLKTLIWFAALTDSSELEDVLPPLIDLPYSNPKAAVHLIYAVGYWLESRPHEFADEHRQRLREKWPIAGSRIRG